MDGTGLYALHMHQAGIDLLKEAAGMLKLVRPQIFLALAHSRYTLFEPG
jgi:hypothetical protein